MKALIIALALLTVAAPVAAQQTVAVDITKASMAWTWTKGTGGDVAEFVVKCGTATGAYTLPEKIVAAPATTIAVKDVVPAPGNYFCVVAARNQFGTSGTSNELAFAAGTVPVAPTGFQLIAQ